MGFYTDFFFRYKTEGSGDVVAKNTTVSKSTRSMSKSYVVAQKDIKKTDKGLQDISKDANRASTNIKGLTSAFKGFNQILGVGKLYALSNAMAKVVNSSIDAIEQTNLFNVALGNMANEADTYIQSMNDAFGFDVTNMRSAVGTFSLLARSMGMTSKNASILSVNTNKLAYDLASMTNVPISQVMQDLRSGLVGQSETVYKYGIDVTEASLKTEAMNQGISKSVRNMSQGEKMALRYAVMIRQTTLAQGDFARTINTPANQLKILSERFVTLGRAIGNMFLPILAKVLPYLNAVVMALIKIFDLLALLVGYEAPKINENIGNQGFSGIEDGADSATDAVNGTKKALDKLKNFSMGFDELNVIDTTSADAGAGGGGGVSAGMPLDLDKFGIEYDNLMSTVKSKADEILADIEGKIKEIFATVIGIGVAMSAWQLGTKLLTQMDDFNKATENLTKKTDKLMVGFGVDPDMVAQYSKVLGIIGGIALLLGLMAYRIMDLTLNSEAFRTGMERVNITFKYLSYFFEKFKSIIYDNLITPIGEFLVALLPQPILDFFKPIIEFIKGIDADFKDVMITIGGLLLLFSPAGAFGVALLLFEGITLAIRGLGGISDSTWASMKTGLLHGLQDIGDFLKNVLIPIVSEGLSYAFEKVSTFITDTAIPVLESLKPVFDAIANTISEVVMPVFEDLFESVQTIFGGIIEIFKGVITFIKGVFSGDWKLALEGLITIFKGVFTAIAGVVKTPLNIVIRAFESFINKMIDGLNAMIDKINKMIREYNENNGILPDITFRMTRITSVKLPQLASGGSLNDGQAFIAGELGKAEALGSYKGKTTVMPLENTDFVDAMYNAVASAMRDNQDTGGKIIETVVNLDGEVIYKNQQEVTRNRGYDFGLGVFGR